MVGAIAGGAAVGASLIMSDKKNRKKIKDAFTNVKDQAKDYVDDIKEQAQDKKDEVEEKLAEGKEKFKKVAKAAR